MLVHPLPDPVALKIGPLALHWYGLMYLVAFIQVIILGRLRLKQPHIVQSGWTVKNLDDLLFYGALGVFIGGRLGEVLFYNPLYFWKHPLQIFAVWEGGMSYHGGLLGVFFTMWLYGRRHHRKYAEILDFIAHWYHWGMPPAESGTSSMRNCTAGSLIRRCPGQ